MWYFLAVMAAIAAGLVWNHRRNAVRRQAASHERFEQMLKGGLSPSVPAPPQALPTAAGTAPTAEATADTTPAVVYAARAHLLSPVEKLLYYLLRTGLPDLEVFPKVPLAVVIDLPGTGYDHEQQLRRLSRQVVDFVVCDKEMKVVAAVQLAALGPDAVIAQRIRGECLKSAGIRLVTVEPGALPRRTEVRGFVCGGPAAASAEAAPPRPV